MYYQLLGGMKIATFRLLTASFLPCGRVETMPTRPATNLSATRSSEQDPHWYTRRVKESFHIGFHLNIINRDSEIEIPEVHDQNIRNNRKTAEQRTAEGTAVHLNN